MEIPHVDIHRERWRTRLVEDVRHRVIQDRCLDPAVRHTGIPIIDGVQAEIGTTGIAFYHEAQVESRGIPWRADEAPVIARAHGSQAG